MSFSLHGTEEYELLTSLTSKYQIFNNLRSRTAAASRPFSPEEFEKIPVELLWYYKAKTDGEGKRKIVWKDEATNLQTKDVDTVAKSLSSGICDVATFEAMIRLATVVRCPSGYVLNPFWPTSVISSETGAPPPPPTQQEQPKDELDVDGMMIQDGADQSATGNPEGQELEPLSLDKKIPMYSYLCAYLIRYAYRLPGENWAAKIEDFKMKYNDMMKHAYIGPEPSVSWANSFNTMSKDLKYKVRILIYLIIKNDATLNDRPGDISTAMKYLFCTPFAYYGMASMNQINKCSEILETDAPTLMSFMSLPELMTGLDIIYGVMKDAGPNDWYPYARAYDDAFFSKMSSLSVKKVHFVCLVIINAKGGQTRYINLDEVKSVNMVRDREVLTDIALDIITTAELARPDTSAGIAMKRVNKQEGFKARKDMHRRSLASRGSGRIVNQVLPALDIDSLLK